MRLKDVLKLLVSPHWGDKGITRRGPMAALSRISTRDEVRLEPPGLDVTGITTDDIDSATGRVFPDYLERRRRREEERAGDKDEGVAFDVYENWK